MKLNQAEQRNKHCYYCEIFAAQFSISSLNHITSMERRKMEQQLPEQSAKELIDQKIKELNDWRGEALAKVRAIILKAEPGITEECKWMGTPVWSKGGILCTGEVYKAVVKLTFAQGAALPDPSGLFNSSLEGKVRRAIDIRKGETLHEEAFTTLIREAAKYNLMKKGKK
jgi:hypothetical protein